MSECIKILKEIRSEFHYQILMGPPIDCGPLYMNKIRNRIKVLDECIEKLKELENV